MQPISEVRLSAIAVAVLLLVQGCCGNDEERREERYTGTITGERLETVRTDETTAEARCESACREIAADEGPDLDAVLGCSAEGNVVVDDPWATTNTQVSIACTGEFTTAGFCTGRRPQGHHEVAYGTPSIGAWLAIHAHLEAASVTAFDELAGWLARRAAPAELVARCRSAAADEREHAARMSALARREGAEVPRAVADPPAHELLAVALHNAVEGCVHEAFAAIVAALQASTAALVEHREVFACIAADELAHGQLAWDLQRWLLARLSSAERRMVARAQQRALDELPRVAAANARATPPGLGWPSPTQAARMAARFAELVARSVTP